MGKRIFFGILGASAQPNEKSRVRYKCRQHLTLGPQFRMMSLAVASKRTVRLTLIPSLRRLAKAGGVSLLQGSAGSSNKVGTTRSRVSFFMNRFRKLGFIHYAGGVEGGLQVHSSLLNVVLHD